VSHQAPQAILFGTTTTNPIPKKQIPKEFAPSESSHPNLSPKFQDFKVRSPNGTKTKKQIAQPIRTVRVNKNEQNPNSTLISWRSSGT
jgi:hypothetical protein